MLKINVNLKLVESAQSCAPSLQLCGGLRHYSPIHACLLSFTHTLHYGGQQRRNFQGTRQYEVKGLGILRFSQKQNGKIDKSVAVCRYCKCELKYFGNSTNLSNHLHRRHAIKVEIPTAAPVSAEASISGSGLRSPNLFDESLSANSHHAKALTASITRFICKDMQHYSVVENTGFREMINTLEPRY